MSEHVKKSKVHQSIDFTFRKVLVWLNFSPFFYRSPRFSNHRTRKHTFLESYLSVCLSVVATREISKTALTISIKLGMESYYITTMWRNMFSKTLVPYKFFRYFHIFGIFSETAPTTIPEVIRG